MRTTTLVIAALSLVPTVCIAQDAPGSRSDIVGVWRVAEVRTVTADTESINSDPLPGLYIFTDGYYSAVWSTSDKPRQMYADRWQPTAAEKIAAYDSIVVNAGTYELSQSELITRPQLARVPGFGGGRAVWNYRIDGDTLYLEMIEEFTKDGTRAKWLDQVHFPIKLIRLKP